MRVIRTAPRTQRPLRTGPRQSTGRGRAGRRDRGRDRAEKRVLAGSQRTGDRGSQRFSVARLGTGRAVVRSVGTWGRPVAEREGSPIPGIPSRVDWLPSGDQPEGRSGATEPNVAREISERVGGPGAMNRQHSEVVLQRNAHSSSASPLGLALVLSASETANVGPVVCTGRYPVHSYRVPQCGSRYSCPDCSRAPPGALCMYVRVPC